MASFGEIEKNLINVSVRTPRDYSMYNTIEMSLSDLLLHQILQDHSAKSVLHESETVQDSVSAMSSEKQQRGRGAGIVTYTSLAAGVRMIIATHIHSGLWDFCPGTFAILHHLPKTINVSSIAWEATCEANHRDRALTRR